jgi:hypothetical protein
MTQFNFGTIVATAKSGSGLAADLNAWRDALHTTHKGSARPSYAVPGLSWLNDIDEPWEDYIFDGTNDALKGFVDPVSHRYSSAANQAKTVASGGAQAHLADWGTLFNMTGSAAQTVAIDPLDTLLAGWWMRVIAQSVTVTINPFGAETIDGLPQVLLPAGSSTTVFFDGTSFYTDQNGGGASAFPVGGVVYVPSSAPPLGFLKMNGALLSRLTYGGLWGFAQASNNITPTDAAWEVGKFSPGDGSTTFRIPDGRGAFMRAWDDARGTDPGRALGTFQDHAMQSHAHSASSGTVSQDHVHYVGIVTDAQGNHSHSSYGPWRPGGGGSIYIQHDSSNEGDCGVHESVLVGNTGAAGNHQHNVNGNTGGISANHTHGITVNAAGSGNENRPKNVSLLACIKF